MDAREALDKTIESFNLKAATIAKKAGIGANELSRYRRGHNDIYSSRAFEIIKALPVQAQIHFWMLYTQDKAEDDETFKRTPQHAS